MNLNKGSKLLVVAAHPDDEILGCGGTLAKAIALGVEVAVLFLGEGVSARFPIDRYENEEFHNQTTIRNANACSAMNLLGIKEYKFGERLCGQFDKYPILSLVKSIEEEMEQFSPDILFTHNSSEVNIDHRLTYEAVEIACRPTRDYIPREIYSFEIPCSGSWTFQSTFKPNVFVDISDYFDLKMKAWSCYESEARPFPFPRSVEGLLALSQYRGMMSNLMLAEGFKLLRMTIK